MKICLNNIILIASITETMSKFDRPTSAKGDCLLDKSMGDTQSKFNSTSIIKLKKSKNKVSTLRYIDSNKLPK